MCFFYLGEVEEDPVDLGDDDKELIIHNSSSLFKISIQYI